VQVQVVSSTYIKKTTDLSNLDKFKDLRNDNIYINEVCDKYIVEEFINGTEHNLDIVIYDDVVYFWHVSDDGIDWQNFQDTQTSFPSKLKDKSKLDMFEQAKLILKALEIRNGVYHFEFKFDKNKSYLIELNPRRPGGKYVEYIERLYGNNLEYDDILIEIGDKPYMNKKALKMINPKKEICENEIFAHILNNESIGIILLKNKKFKKNLDKIKNLNYEFYKDDYTVVNGTHEQDYYIDIT
jgi:biotin carboxylase